MEKKDFSDEVRLDSHHSSALINRADLYRKTGKLDLATADYKKALSLDMDAATRQNVVAALSSLGVTTGDTGADPDYQGCEKLSGAARAAACGACHYAATSCDRAIASKNFGGAELSELYRLRGWERRERNDADGAMSDNNLALQTDPANLNAYYHRGRLFHARNQVELAIKDFDEASSETGLRKRVLEPWQSRPEERRYRTSEPRLQHGAIRKSRGCDQGRDRNSIEGPRSNGSCAGLLPPG